MRVFYKASERGLKTGDADASEDYNTAAAYVNCTAKRSWLHQIAKDTNRPIEDVLQDARVWEWYIAQRTKDLAHRRHYFLIVVKYRIARETPTWWTEKRNELDDPTSDIYSVIPSMRGFNELILTRDFDTAMSENLEQHIMHTLAAIDAVLLEMYNLRRYDTTDWEQVRKLYPQLSRRKFKSRVRKIRKVVEEIWQTEFPGISCRKRHGK